MALTHKRADSEKSNWQQMLPWVGAAVVAGFTVAVVFNIEPISRLTGFNFGSAGIVQKDSVSKVVVVPDSEMQMEATTIVEKQAFVTNNAEIMANKTNSASEEIASEAGIPDGPLPSPKLKRYDGPLPKLGNSDIEILQALAELLFHPKLANWFVPEELVSKVVLAVDNIAGGDTINKHRPVYSPKTQFQANSAQKPVLIDEKNYRRYYVYVDLLESFDINQAMAFYRHYRPLFQQAYAELGYPKKSFDKRLLQAIDMLLATPVLQHELTLVQPSVLFKFADRKIEALPPAQKWLLRMGAANQARISKRLRNIRVELVKPRNRS